jgi:hypothetical protein
MGRGIRQNRNSLMISKTSSTETIIMIPDLRFFQKLQGNHRTVRISGPNTLALDNFDSNMLISTLRCTDK